MSKAVSPVSEMRMADSTQTPESGQSKAKRKTKKYLWLFLAAFLFAVMSYYMFDYPRRTIGPRQPIPFSHRIHAGVKAIPCQFCHPYTARSQNAGLPPLEKCFFCHTYIIPQHPQIVKEHDYFIQKKPVPWVRIFYVPDFVFFRHQPHILWAKLDCTNCHGDVKTQDRLKPVNFQMGFCIKCHRKLAPEKKLLHFKGPPIAMFDCWLACHR